MNMSPILRLPGEIHLSRSSWNVQGLPSLSKLLQNPNVLLTSGKVRNPWRLPRKTTAERPKALRIHQFLTLLTSRCASRTLFGQKLWSHTKVFCTFGFRHVLRATIFSTSQLPKAVPHWSASRVLTWTWASGHNGVQLFISYLATWLRTRRFSEPACRPTGTTYHEENTMFGCVWGLSSSFAVCQPGSSFIWLSLLWSPFFFSSPSLTLPISVLHLSILSEVWLPSKLPSIMYMYANVNMHRYTYRYRYYRHNRYNRYDRCSVSMHCQAPTQLMSIWISYHRRIY